MRKLIFGGIAQIADEEVPRYLDILPDFMRREIARYKVKQEQKLRILSRLLLLSALKQAIRPLSYTKSKEIATTSHLLKNGCPSAFHTPATWPSFAAILSR